MVKPLNDVPAPDDKDFVASRVGPANDRGILIGFGFTKDGHEMWMVERPDKTVFTAPAVQMARLWRSDYFDGFHEELVDLSGVGWKVRIARLRKRE